MLVMLQFAYAFCENRYPAARARSQLQLYSHSWSKSGLKFLNYTHEKFLVLLGALSLSLVFASIAGVVDAQQHGMECGAASPSGYMNCPADECDEQCQACRIRGPCPPWMQGSWTGYPYENGIPKLDQPWTMKVTGT